MRISERQMGNVIVLDVSGRLAGRQAADAMSDAVRRGGRAGARTLVVNLGRVRSVDLAGLGALVEGYRVVRAAGVEVRLAALTRRIQDLLVITRLATVFDAFNSVEEAVQPAMFGAATRAARTPPSAMRLGPIQRFLRRA